jgi:hypothetical protein
MSSEWRYVGSILDDDQTVWKIVVGADGTIPIDLGRMACWGWRGGSPHYIGGGENRTVMGPSSAGS